MRTLLTAALLAASGAGAFAAENPDIQAGKALHDKQCVACHVQRWGGDGSAAYTRADRKIKDAASLRQRVAMCSAQTGAKFFPEDEANVAAYLGRQYYKFK